MLSFCLSLGRMQGLFQPDLPPNTIKCAEVCLPCVRETKPIIRTFSSNNEKEVLI